MPLLPANEEAIFLINKAMPGLIVGGQVNYQVIDMVFRLYGVEEGRRPELFEKFQAYIGMVLEHLANEASK